MSADGRPGPVQAQPPRLARWLLRRLLDGPVRSAIVGDLDEEFACFAVPRLGLRRARRWYWRQTVASLAACLRAPAIAPVHPDDNVTVRSTLMNDRRGWESDLAAAWRFASRRPLQSIVVVLTLAIGLGATTAVFSILNATFLKRLPIANADRLVFVGSKEGGSFTYPEYLASKNAAGFAALIAGGREVTTLGDEITRQRVIVDLVSGNFFDALGVANARGRYFHEDDDKPGAMPVVVLSDALWRDRFHADPSIIGQTVRIHRSFYTVLGIAPPGFFGMQIGFGPDLWMPLTQGPLVDGNTRMLSRDSAWLGLAGILRDRGALEAARASLTAIWQASQRKDEATLQLTSRGEVSYRDPETFDTRLKALTLFVVLILFIACLNVSTLLGANVHARQKELAIRATLGAGRLRLARQLLVEHLFLSAIGGTLGGFAGVWFARVLSSMTSGRFSSGDLDVSLDRNVLIFTTAISIVAGVVVGLTPALRWSRVSTLAALQSGSGGLHRMFRSTGLWWLIPGQVALGTVLLVSAGLLSTTVQQLKRGIEGTAPERVWFADLELTDIDPLAGGAMPFGDLQERLRAHLRTLPGAEVVSLTTLRPLASLRRGPLYVEGMTTVPSSKPMPWGPPPPPPPRGARLEKMWTVSNSYVTPGFFQSLALPLTTGRDFTSHDVAGAPRVAIVNETLARRAFGKANPIGRRLSFPERDRFDIEIVGVVRDLRYEHLRESAPDGIFFPLGQLPVEAAATPTVGHGRPSVDLTVVVRARDGVTLTRDALRQHVLAFDYRLFVDRIWTFDEEAGRALSQERMLAWLGSLLGAVALLLLVVGLYGTMTAAVVRGRRELGIRLALGASPRSLRGLVVTRSLVVVAVGLILGLPLAYMATTYFAHMLYGVRPVEPLLTATIAVMLGLTAVLSSYLPARRAGRVDPVIALRAE